MAQGCKIEESVTGSSYFLEKRKIFKMYDYVEHVNGYIPLHIKQFDRKYKYSTLQYFHKELGISK